MRSRPPEYSGAKLSIEALRLDDGSCPAGDFLDALEKADRRKLDVLFQMMGDFGQIRNPEKFKKLIDSEGIFEFKNFQIRIPCFFTTDRRVMLCFGVVKKKDKLSKEEIRRAEDYRKQYFQRTSQRK